MQDNHDSSGDPLADLRQQLLNAQAAFEASERLEKFTCLVFETPAGHKLPKGFEQEWDNLLTDYEAELKEHFEQQPDAPKGWEIAIRRGWVIADVEAQRLVSHLEEPDQSLHPIPAILQNDDGNWELASIMVTMVRAHPYVRAITEKLLVLSTKEEVLEAIAKSKAIQTDEPHGANLAIAADRLDLFLHIPSFGAEERKEYGWMHDAKSSQQFWDILNAAIGFGRSLARYDSLGSGKARELLLHGLLLRRGQGESRHTPIIRKLIQDYEHETGNRATAKKLLSWIGGSKSKLSDDAPLVLPDKHKCSLHGISWTKWNNCVRNQLKKST